MLHFLSLRSPDYLDHPSNINFTQFSHTLEELVLECEELTDSSFKSLKSLTKLKVLSLPASAVICGDFLLEIVGSTNQLRYILNDQFIADVINT